MPASKYFTYTRALFSLFRNGQYLTHAHSHITRRVAAMDSCFTLIACSETQGLSVGSGEKAGRKLRAKEPLGNDSHQTIFKNSSECWLLIGHKKCFVLLCPIGQESLLSSFREFVHHLYCLATLARFVHQAYVCKGNLYFLLS